MENCLNGGKIRCPITAIHGVYDPYHFEGIREPLSEIVKDFRLIMLEKCGHKPWSEREVKEKFYEILKQEIQDY